MATLEDIFTEWANDSKIDKADLDNESLNTPMLHAKYVKMFAMERLSLQRLEIEYKTLFKLKSEYFAGTLDLDTIRERSWAPNPKMILKTDINMHIEADQEIQKLSLKIGLQREKISTLDSILKTIANRGFQIKNAIDYMKLMNGM